MSSKSKGLTTLQAEPAMVRAVVVALLLLSSLGVGWAADLDPETITAWAVALGIIVPLVQGVWTRYAVTANAKVVARVTTAGEVVAGDAAVAPSGDVLPLDNDAGDLLPPALYPVGVKPELVADPPL